MRKITLLLATLLAILEASSVGAQNTMEVTYQIEVVQHEITTSTASVTYNIYGILSDGSRLDKKIEYIGATENQTQTNALYYTEAVQNNNTWYPDVTSTELATDASGNAVTAVTVSFPQGTLVPNNYTMFFPAGTLQAEGCVANGSELFNHFTVLPPQRVTYQIEVVQHEITTSTASVTYNIYGILSDGSRLDKKIEYIGATENQTQTNALYYTEAVQNNNTWYPDVTSTELATDASGNAVTAVTVSFPQGTLVPNNYTMFFPAGTLQAEGCVANGSELYNNFTVLRPEPYAVLSSDGNLTFYYDGNKSTREGTKKYDLPWDSFGPQWTLDHDNVTTVTFDASFAGYRLSYAGLMFAGIDLKTINNIEYLNTEEVTNMERMFYGCSELTSLDLSNFNTANVTNMKDMFDNCYNLETIYCAENANWSNVTNTTNMFTGSTKLSGKYGSEEDPWNSSYVNGTYAKACTATKYGYFTSKTYKVTLNDNGYATFASKLPVDFTNAEGYTAWQITGINGNNITFKQITGAVAGSTGVLLMGTASANITITYTTSGEDISSTNLFEGIITPTSINAGVYYGLSGAQFVPVNDGEVPAGKALLPAEKVPNVKSLNLVFNDETGISLTPNPSPQNEGSWYDLQGRKLEGKPAQKGLYIVNGKKMFIQR